MSAIIARLIDSGSVGHAASSLLKSASGDEVSLALDNYEAAKTVQQKALAIIDDKRLRNAIPAANEP